MGRIECSEKQDIKGIAWMVEGVQNPVFVARAVITPQTKLVPVRLINTDLIPVTLYRGTKLANAETVDERNVNIVGNFDVDAHSDTPMPVYADSINRLPDDFSQSQQDKFLALLSLYSDVIAAGPDDLGHTQVLSHHIDTGDAPPIRQAACRVPMPCREKVQQLLQDMLSKKIISPSKSLWASPVVLIQRKDGSIRFCIDYRKVNAVTRKDAYPLPRVDDTFDTLAGSSWFSTLDLKTGYWQVKVNPSDREKTAFCTQQGLFEFNVMPLGLCNAPATFQRLMNLVLAGIQWNICLVFGKTFEQHLHNLQQVLDRLQQAGMKLHPSKCQFLQHKVTFLGHIISQDGIYPNPDKKVRVAEWPTPKSAKEVQQLLGLANYYRRFVKDFAAVAKPLHKLTEKGVPFLWSDQCQSCFNTL